MKKYTAPEIEVIKFQALETIADDVLDGDMTDGSYFGPWED